MRTSIVILFCLTSTLSNAQQTSNSYTSQIDSVQTILDKISKKDTLRVIELNRLALLCIYDLQYERGLTAAIEARALARTMNYPQGEGMYWRTFDMLHPYVFAEVEPYGTLAFWSFDDVKKRETPINIQSPARVDYDKRKVALTAALQAMLKSGNKKWQPISITYWHRIIWMKKKLSRHSNRSRKQKIFLWR